MKDLPRLANFFSLARVHGILRKHLKLGEMNARWISHLLTDEQKRSCVLNHKKLLKMFPEYSKNSFNNLVTGDETGCTILNQSVNVLSEYGLQKMLYAQVLLETVHDQESIVCNCL